MSGLEFPASSCFSISQQRTRVGERESQREPRARIGQEYARESATAEAAGKLLGSIGASDARAAPEKRHEQQAVETTTVTR